MRYNPSMDIAAEIERFDPSVPIERAWTPPSSWYVAPEFHELEQCAVLGRSWQPVARLAQLEGPGAYVSGMLAGEPFVVVRDGAGVLRAFHNTCRHKGREVVQGCGHTERLVCGYHAWTYGLDGSLRSAPGMAGIEDFERGAMSLAPLAAEVWGQWVFLNLDPHAAPLAARVAPLEERLATAAWDELEFVSAQSWVLECNWKVYVDNYLDGGYHIPHMHPSLDAQIDMQSYRTEVSGEVSLQSSLPAQAPSRELGFDAGERIGREAVYAWIHPNFMLNRYGPCLDTNHVLPLGPERCEVRYEFWFERALGAAGERFVQESIAQSAVTQREDIAICESVQVGLRSRGYDRGRYAPRVELGEHHFHRLLARDLGAGLSG